MSKAFTREADDSPEEPLDRPLPSSHLPPGTKNYTTADGARRLRAILDDLVQTKRPRITSSPITPDTQRQLQNLDRQIQHLRESLDRAVIVPPPPAPWEQVHFGATVTVRDRRSEETRYRLVGVDETDVDRGWVSWLSPIARALNQARLGQRVRFRFPSGEDTLEIIRIEYE